MFGLGRFEELLLILVIILVLFGGKKLPELSRGISNSIKEIRKAFKDDESDDKTKPAKTKSKTKSLLKVAHDKKKLWLNSILPITSLSFVLDYS